MKEKRISSDNIKSGIYYTLGVIGVAKILSLGSAFQDTTSSCEMLSIDAMVEPYIEISNRGSDSPNSITYMRDRYPEDVEFQTNAVEIINDIAIESMTGENTQDPNS